MQNELGSQALTSEPASIGNLAPAAVLPPHAARYVGSDGRDYPVAIPRWRDDAGRPLNLSPGSGLTRSQIDQGERSLWRYGAAIRTSFASRISLGEGWTPLIEQSWQDRRVLCKLEYLAPTGSFKDRGTTVLLSYLRDAGIDFILEDSSGNAGASMAAYAAAGGLRCRILAPASAPAGKIAQMSGMGAEVALIDGDRQAVADAALREAEHIFYASHNWHPYFLEGTKTLAFELWEQVGFSAPDAVVVPCGYGSNVLGLWIGFNELVASGAIERVPRIYAVQAAASAPFFAVYRSGGCEWVPIEPRPTIADGIASVRPTRIRDVMEAVRGSQGAVLAVEEEEIKGALTALLRQGLFVEPTSAAAAAGLSRLIEDGTIGSEESVALVLTGSGLKASDKIAQLLNGH